MTNLLAAERIVLLHAPSGAGKSSLLNAGLLPKLEMEKNLQVLPVLRVNRLPENAVSLPEGTNRYALSALLSMEEAFGDAALPEAELAGMSLTHYLELRWPEDPQKRGRLLLLDQFEEVFSLDPYDRQTKLDFFNQLSAVLQNRSIKALLAMRDDYIGALEPYSVLLPTQLHTAFRLDFLDHTAAREAIIKPAEQAGILFDEGAARELAHDLSLVQFQRLDGTTEQQEGPYIEPVQLQVVCKRLWERLETAGRLLDGIDQKDVEELGDVSDALAGYYRDSVSATAREQKVPETQIRRWIGKELISEQGVRGQVMLVAEQTKGLPNRVITALEGAHLLRREERRRVIWYELAHDRLVPAIQRDNLHFFEAHRARQLKQVFSALGGIILVVLLITGYSAWYAQSSANAAMAAAKTATQAFSIVEQDAKLATRDAGTALANAQIATFDAATAQANATQAALSLLPFPELQKLSRSGDPEERIRAARALGNAGAANPDIAEDAAFTLIGLTQTANENDGDVRLAATLGLKQIAESNPAVLGPTLNELFKAFDRNNEYVQILLVQVLDRVGAYVNEPDFIRITSFLQELSETSGENISQAARESLSTLAGLGISNFVGSWVNSDANTRGWTRIEIRQRGEDLGYHIFGKCQPRDCDIGEAWAQYSPGSQNFLLDQGFATQNFTVTLDIVGQILIVESLTHYVDNSGRSDLFFSGQFEHIRAAQSTPSPTPRPQPIVPIEGPRLFAALFWESKGLAIIDLEAGRIIHTTEFPSINARYLSFNPRRREVYVSFANGDTLYIVDAYSGEIKGTITEEVGWNSSASVVSPDGKRLYLATSGGPEKERSHKILVIDPEAQRLEKVFNLGPAPSPATLSGLAITADGGKLYTVDSYNYMLYIIDAETGEKREQYIKGNQLAGISQDGRYAYLVGDRLLLKWDVESEDYDWYREHVRETIDRVAVGGGLVYVPGEKERIILIDEKKGEAVGEFVGPAGVSLVLSPDGAFLYTAEGNSILVYNTRSYQLVQEIPITKGSGPTDLVYWDGR